ncbi:type-F conjugative transfer system secretin TraK [Sphingobium cupriresistens]|uniref:type-F conjugative transfer system secretin TraK n=1 Tax=Sphingobium cupriresistens TaxID=1132417 RepID=UPI003BAE13C3
MPKSGRPFCAAIALVAAPLSTSALAQAVVALPDQMSTIRLSNRDVNHLVCQGGEVDEVKYSAEKGLAVEKAGADAWIKFLVKESDDNGQITRSYVTSPSEFFVTCNGAIYPLYAEPSDIPAQTIMLAPGARQRARANEDLLAPLVEEERAVSITLSLFQDRVPASFSDVAVNARPIALASAPTLRLTERRRVLIEGAGLNASEYWVEASTAGEVDERLFLDPTLGARIFSVTLDRLNLKAGETARLIILRRGDAL